MEQLLVFCYKIFYHMSITLRVLFFGNWQHYSDSFDHLETWINYLTFRASELGIYMRGSHLSPCRNQEQVIELF